MAAKPCRIFGYARTSTDKQELSLLEQQEMVRARAERITREESETARYAACFSEHESAVFVSWRNRPQFQSLLREIESGDILVVWRLDRIDRQPFRMLAALDQLTERKIRVIALELEFGGSATKWELDLSTSPGRAMVMMMGMVGEWWLGSMREAVRAACKRLHKEGYVFLSKKAHKGFAAERPCGKAGRQPGLGKGAVRVDLPEGKTTNSKLPFRFREVWDPEQCEYILEAWIRRKLFREPLQDIVRDYHERGLRTWGGVPWVRIRKESYTPRPNEQLPRKPVVEYNGHRVRAAINLMDKLIAEKNLPPELHVNEHMIRQISRRICDPSAFRKLVEEEIAKATS